MTLYKIISLNLQDQIAHHYLLLLTGVDELVRDSLMLVLRMKCS